MAVDDRRCETGLCDLHPGNKLVLYCKTCEVPVCTKCLTSGSTGNLTSSVYGTQSTGLNSSSTICRDASGYNTPSGGAKSDSKVSRDASGYNTPSSGTNNNSKIFRDTASTNDLNKTSGSAQTDGNDVSRVISSASGIPNHADHVYLDLVDAYDIGKEELEKLLAGFRDDLNEKRAERQALHTKLQKLQLSLLRKKTELGKSGRALQDCLIRREKTFLTHVDNVMQPALTRCDNKHKDVEFDVVSRDGLLTSAESVLSLPHTRVLSFLKAYGNIRRELLSVRRRTFTETDDCEHDAECVRKLGDLHLNLHREKQLIDRAFAFPNQVPEAPRMLPGWCVIGDKSAALVWKFRSKDAVKVFHVYVKPRGSYYSDRKYTDNYKIKEKTVVVKKTVKVKKKQRAKAKNVQTRGGGTPKTNVSRKVSWKSSIQESTAFRHPRADVQLIPEKEQMYESNDQTRRIKDQRRSIKDQRDSTTDQNNTTETGASKWWSLSSWKKTTNLSSASDAAQAKSKTGNDVTQKGMTSDQPPSWFVVEPVEYVESLCGQEEEVHASLSRSIALTDALRRRSQGLKKRSSVSDQYLCSPVLRPKNSENSLFGSRAKQDTIKEADSKETLDSNPKPKDTDCNESKSAKNVTETTHLHRYTAIDTDLIQNDGFQLINVAKFLPGRVSVVLRDLLPGQEYMACIRAINQCGESESVVVHFKTSDLHTTSQLHTLCKPVSRWNRCKQGCNSMLRLGIVIFGLVLYAILVCLLFVMYIQNTVCSRFTEELESFDSTGVSIVCPQYYVQKPEVLEFSQVNPYHPKTSWVEQAFSYLQNIDIYKGYD